MNIQATSDQMFAEVIFKYIGKVGISNIKEFSFLFNSNPINPSTFKSLNDLGINNGAIIRVVKGDAGQIKYMNICFSIIGRNVIVQGQSNMKFSELVAKFSIKADIKPEDEFLFRVYNDNNDNYTLMNFIPNNLEYNDENSDFINKKIWYVLRPQEIKNNEKKYNEDYYLNVNDIIKMGKMKFVVQKICIAGKNENSNDKIGREPIFNLIYQVGNNLETYDKNECIFCPDTETQRKKISEDKKSEDFLTSLCKCNKPNIHYI